MREERLRTRRGGTFFLTVLSTLAVAVASFGFIPAQSAEAAPVSLERITEARVTQPNSYSAFPDMTPDGRFVVFTSAASNLVNGDTNGQTDVFVYDKNSGEVELVSRHTNGTLGNSSSGNYYSSISDDGRYVVFESDADNLVDADSNSSTDVFVRDRQTDTTTQVSLNSSEVASDNSSYSGVISGDGNWIAFRSNANNLSVHASGSGDIYMRDWQEADPETIQVSKGYVDGFDHTNSNNLSDQPSISEDGRYVVFFSRASNLTAESDTVDDDIFRYDRQTDTIEWVSAWEDSGNITQAAGAGNAGLSSQASISADGRYVAFRSNATNLVMDQDTNWLDLNGRNDVFLKDMDEPTMFSIQLVSVDSNEVQHNDVDNFAFPARISANGNYVSFVSAADTLVTDDTNFVKDVFVRNISAGTTERVSLGINNGTRDSESDSDTEYMSAPSDNGLFVAFETYATNLLPVGEDTNFAADIYYRESAAVAGDRDTFRIGMDPSVEIYAGGNEETFESALSRNGAYAVFDSDASNLVDEDSNNETDIFLYNRLSETIELISVNSNEEQAEDGNSHNASVTANGRYVVFDSSATNLIVGEDDFDGRDIYLRDRNGGGVTTKITDGANGPSVDPVITPNGRYVVFQSSADNLVEGVEDGTQQVYLYDRTLDTFELISMHSDETPGSNSSFGASITDDGRYVVFQSDADNLVADDTNGNTDTFLRNRLTGTTERISLSDLDAEIDNGSIDSQISGSGNRVAFSSYATHVVTEVPNDGGDGGPDWRTFIYVRDLSAGTTEIVSVDSDEDPADDESESPKISADGSIVVFHSTAANLDAGDVGGREVFMRDLDAGTTERVSATPDEDPGSGWEPFISADGTTVTFTSNSPALTDGESISDPDLFMAMYDGVIYVTPVVQTNFASSVQDNSATLNGEIIDPGLSVPDTRGFEYGTTTAYGDFVSESGAFGSGEFSLGVTGLACGTTYHFRAFAAAGADTGYGNDFTFTTDDCGSTAEPTVVTNAASAITQTGATLEGEMTDEGLSEVTERGFEYGTTTAYGDVVSESGSFTNGPFDLPVTGLTCNTLYYFRAYAESADGFGYGSDETFTTSACDPAGAPTVVTGVATSITETTATLNGDITDEGTSTPTTRGFEYGLTNTYGSTTSTSGTYTTGAYSTNIIGLTCNTLYHFRAIAASDDGSANGADQTFTTTACPPAGGGGGGSSSGSTASQGSNRDPHPNGTLILDGSTIYLIKDGQRYGFRDAEEYRSYGYNFNQTVLISDKDKTLPAAPEALKAMTGALVLDKSDNRTVYMIGLNNTKRGFSSEAVFFALGYDYDNLFAINVSDYATGAVINTAQAAHPEGSLVRENDVNGTVWWILDGKRHGFESQQVFDTYGFSFARLVPANSHDLSLTPSSLVKFRDGTLVKDGASYYIISDGKKLEFSSTQALQNWGYKLSNVIAASLVNYTAGYDMK